MQKDTPQYIADNFNKKYPVGSKVYWRSFANDDTSVNHWTVREAATVVPQWNLPMCKFEEKGGYCRIDPQFIKEDIVAAKPPTPKGE